MTFAEERLQTLERAGLKRSLAVRSAGILNFSSNDYLNLRNHPRVKAGAIQAIERYGTGSGGSRLMAGNLEIHEALEDRLAEITGMESALVFGSGFLANTGVVSAVAGRNDTIFTDRLNHASLVDGTIHSRAKVRRYRHRDTGHLEEILSQCETGGRRVIVTDSVFSMDGDIAPLREIHRIALEHRCMLIVDEAHGLGVFGGGGGVCRKLGITPDITTGTLSKALGGYGGFAACSGELREYLVNSSRSFIYSTGLPPGSAGGALAALDILSENRNMGKELLKRARAFRRGLAEMGLSPGESSSQIVPLETGDPSGALELSSRLENRGILAVAVRPPTVPRGTSRLRFSLTLAHSPRHIDETLDALRSVLL